MSLFYWTKCPRAVAGNMVESPDMGVGTVSEFVFYWTGRGKNLKIARLVCEAFHGASSERQALCASQGRKLAE